MRPFKSQIIGRRYIQNKAEIYMHQKTFLLVDQDVAVVTVLHLKDVRDNGICGLRANEVLPRLLKPEIVLWAEITQEKLIERLLVCLTD